MENNQALDKDISAGMLIKFALPTIATMLFMNIYSVVDGVFVSQLIGTDALSSVNIIMPLIIFSMAIGMMFGSGGNALVAKMIGEGDEPGARRIF